MMDETNNVAANAQPAATTDPVVQRLKDLGVQEELIPKIKDLGVDTVDELVYLKREQLINIGMKEIKADKLLTALAPVAAAASPDVDLKDDEEPSKTQMARFAGNVGMKLEDLLLIMGMGGMGSMGQLGEGVDISAVIPVANVVAGYNPKIRNLYSMVLGQIARYFDNIPIVVINSDGGINRTLTVEYIEGLQIGREVAENNIYYDDQAVPHEVIRVGVDAQSIYDADPLVPTKALQQNGMGTGRIQWKGVPLETRQTAFYAATVTHEIDPNNDSDLSWLRDNISPDANRLVFHGQAPKAVSEYNKGMRTGSLPTLRVMLSRSPRRQEIMPRRRSVSPKDLTGVAARVDPFGKNTET